MTRTCAWWEEGGGYYTPEYYQGDFGSASLETVSVQVSFFEHALALSPGARILDVGCGMGHVSIELAKRGYQATGVDINRSFLRRACRDAARAGVAPRFLRKDMRALAFDQEFDSVFCVGPSFGQFSEDDNHRAVSEMARSLRPGGFLLIEQWVIHREDRDEKPRKWEEKSSTGESIKMTSWSKDGRTYISMEYENGKSVTIDYQKYSEAGLSNVLSAVGMLVRRIYFLDFWKYIEVSAREEAWRLMVVAQK